jgi:hypothetical protein
MLLADSEAELYIVKERLPHFPEPEPVVRGCAYGQKRSYLLGEAEEHGSSYGGSGSSGVRLATLAGAIVAYTESAVYGSGKEEAPRYLMVVRDLSTGRILHRVITGRFVKPEATPVSVGLVTSLVVKSDGATAWIVETGVPATYQTYAIDKTGRRMLASSAAIVPYSLALAGSTLYWTQGDQPFSASLK